MVAPDKQSGQSRELLVSAKEISRVANVTGTPNSGVDIAWETYGVSPKKFKHDRVRVNQDDKCITRQQTRTMQLLAKAEDEQVSILIEEGAPQVNFTFDNFTQSFHLTLSQIEIEQLHTMLANEGNFQFEALVSE